MTEPDDDSRITWPRSSMHRLPDVADAGPRDTVQMEAITRPEPAITTRKLRAIDDEGPEEWWDITSEATKTEAVPGPLFETWMRRLIRAIVYSAAAMVVVLAFLAWLLVAR